MRKILFLMICSVLVLSGCSSKSVPQTYEWDNGDTMTISLSDKPYSFSDGSIMEKKEKIADIEIIRDADEEDFLNKHISDWDLVFSDTYDFDSINSPVRQVIWEEKGLNCSMISVQMNEPALIYISNVKDQEKLIDIISNLRLDYARKNGAAEASYDGGLR